MARRKAGVGLGSFGLGLAREGIQDALSGRPSTAEARAANEPARGADELGKVFEQDQNIVPGNVRPQVRRGPYRRAAIDHRDDDGYAWVIPSATAWPHVEGNPPGPRTRCVGYNIETRTVRTVFRDGTQWRYDNVDPQTWERLRRTASTGRFINRVLNSFPYGRDQFESPIQ